MMRSDSTDTVHAPGGPYTGSVRCRSCRGRRLPRPRPVQDAAANDAGPRLRLRRRSRRLCRGIAARGPLGVLELLDRYVPAPAIPLEHADAYQLLVAVILSAQCTHARVNMVTPALFARAPDARDGAAPQHADQAVHPHVRARRRQGARIAKLSRILVREHGGQVPHDLAALETLPGVGHKTASVVVAQAFGEPAFPVDTHIHRLAGRWQLSRARTVEEVEHDLKQLFPRERWSTLHLQFIYFGRQHCIGEGARPVGVPDLQLGHVEGARAARGAPGPEQADHAAQARPRHRQTRSAATGAAALRGQALAAPAQRRRSRSSPPPHRAPSAPRPPSRPEGRRPTRLAGVDNRAERILGRLTHGSAERARLRVSNI